MSFKDHLSWVALGAMGSIIVYHWFLDNDPGKREWTIRRENVQTYEPKAEKQEATKPDLVDQVLEEVKAEETPDWKWLYLNERNQADLAEKDRELAWMKAQLAQVQEQLDSKPVGLSEFIDDYCGRNDTGNTQVVYYNQNGNSYGNSTGTAVLLNRGDSHKARLLYAKKGGNQKTSHAPDVVVMQNIGNGAKVENNFTINVGSTQGTTTETPNSRYKDILSRYPDGNRQSEVPVVFEKQTRGPFLDAYNQNNRVTYYGFLNGALNTAAAAAGITHYLSEAADDIRYIDWLFSGRGRKDWRDHCCVRLLRGCGYAVPLCPPRVPPVRNCGYAVPLCPPVPPVHDCVPPVRNCGQAVRLKQRPPRAPRLDRCR